MSVVRSILALAGSPWGTLAALRRGAYARSWLTAHRLAGPTVSVGNVALGGRGKTPVVRRVCEILLEEGHAPAILSRGYGGSFRARALVASDGEGTRRSAEEVGDEPAMLGRSLPGVVVAVAHRRIDAGRLVEQRWGPRVHVMDDGFQHLALARDLEVVCADARDLDRHPLPAGPLREHPTALRHADVVLLSDDDNRGWERAARRLRSWGVPRVLPLARRIEGIVDADLGPCSVPDRPLLVSAIARPQRFEADARRACGSVAGVLSFRDHHRFTPRDVQRIEDVARAAGADAILTTSKDLERLRTLELALPTRVLIISCVIGDEQTLREMLSDTARGSGRPARASAMRKTEP